MNPRILVPLIAVAALLSGCESYGGGDSGFDHAGYGQRQDSDESWDASQHYRDGDYQERPMSRDERVYRGGDGRYYCRRSDGTAGLIVGGLAGGVLGDAIAPRGSKTLGTVLGALGGAAVGSAVDQNSAHCR